MKKKENQRIALTKRLLKESLIRLMETKSLQAITVSELCESAEINRSTFYNHYGCPADVLREIEMDIVSDLVQIWEGKCAAENWPVNKRAEMLCAYFQDNKKLSKLLLQNSDTNSEFASLMFQLSQVQSAYEQALADWDEDSKRLMITFLCNGSYHMIRQWILEDIPKTPQEMGEIIYCIAKQGWDSSFPQESEELRA